MLPNVAVELSHVTTLLGIRAFQKVPGALETSIVVCTRCSYTSVFTLNGPVLLRSVPGATLMRAQG